MQNDRHVFALYYKNARNQFDVTKRVKEGTITDPTLYHRLVRVLRLGEGDLCIFFDQSIQAHVTIDHIIKNDVAYTVDFVQHNDEFKPFIRAGIPLLKRTALEEAIYSATEIGANEIQLIVTDKVHRSWHGKKELERLEKIIIAAAEQSKNFAFPSLKSPQPFKEVMLHYQQTPRYYFDVAGKSIAQFFSAQSSSYDEYTFLWGPEGDFSPDEKKYMQQQAIPAYCLTPTTLRSQQAIAVGLGIMRSWLY